MGQNQIFPHYVFLLFFTAVKVYCRRLIACFYLERDLIQGTSRGALFSSTAFLVKFGYCKSRRTSPPASSTPISGASDPLLLKYPPWAQPLPPSKADQAPGVASFPGLLPQPQPRPQVHNLRRGQEEAKIGQAKPKILEGFGRFRISLSLQWGCRYEAHLKSCGACCWLRSHPAPRQEDGCKHRAFY